IISPLYCGIAVGVVGTCGGVGGTIWICVGFCCGGFCSGAAGGVTSAGAIGALGAARAACAIAGGTGSAIWPPKSAGSSFIEGRDATGVRVGARQTGGRGPR